MKSLIALVLSFLCVISEAGAAKDPEPVLPPAAVELWNASGGDNWSNIKEIDFNFVVEQEGNQLFSAQHRWNLAGSTDNVKWKDKEGKDHDVTANLAKPA